MPISVTCGGCRKTFSTPDAAAGRRGRCKACGTAVAIPAPAAGVADDLAFLFAAGDDPGPDDWGLSGIAAGAEPLTSRRRADAAPGLEPWYYRFLKIYAYAIISAGAATAALFGAGTLAYLRSAAEVGEVAPGGRLLGVGIALGVPAAILFGSSVIGAPILLAVDLARNLRAIRLQGGLKAG